jgi:ABC-type dipeptide/oligopeptide/nickel transport system ATPase component
MFSPVGAAGPAHRVHRRKRVGQDDDGARGDADAGRARFRVSAGEIHLNSLGDTDILNLSEEEMRRVRLRKISYIPQGAMNSLNPVMRIEHQIWDGILAHEGNVTQAELQRRSMRRLRAWASIRRSWPALPA